MHLQRTLAPAPDAVARLQMLNELPPKMGEP